LGRRKNIRRFIRGRTDDAGSAVLETLIDEVLGWGDVRAQEFYDRGSGPTGLRFYRASATSRAPFMVVFPGKSLQLAHRGITLDGVPVTAKNGDRSKYLVLSESVLPSAIDEARFLAAFAYWAAA
jgi:hypothetical protein